MSKTNDIINWLKKNFADQVKFNEPMSLHTTFRVGGPAEIFIQPVEKKYAVEIINKANKADIPLFIVGKGSNLLVKDSGISGIIMSFEKIEENLKSTDLGNDREIVRAHAGMKLHDLCSYAVKNGLSGMNFALGIPGSVGGSIKMNAGTASGEMKDVVNSIEILNGSGELKTVEKDLLNFSYRKLSWGNVLPEPVIFSADFILQKGDMEELKKDADNLLKSRNKNQPVSLPNAGCIFKNPDISNPAGKLIDLAGLKGEQKGDASISDKHANFIVNNGNATATDIISLINMAKEKVHKQFNINLETEVQIVG